MLGFDFDFEVAILIIDDKRLIQLYQSPTDRIKSVRNRPNRSVPIVNPGRKTSDAAVPFDLTRLKNRTETSTLKESNVR